MEEMIWSYLVSNHIRRCTDIQVLHEIKASEGKPFISFKTHKVKYCYDSAIGGPLRRPWRTQERSQAPGHATSFMGFQS